MALKTLTRDSFKWANGRGHDQKPILYSLKNNSLGLGKSLHTAQTDNWWERAFDNSLKSLSVSQSTTGDVKVVQGEVKNGGVGLRHLVAMGKGRHMNRITFVKGGLLEGTLKSGLRDGIIGNEDEVEEMDKAGGPGDPGRDSCDGGNTLKRKRDPDGAATAIGDKAESKEDRRKPRKQEKEVRELRRKERREKKEKKRIKRESREEGKKGRKEKKSKTLPDIVEDTLSSAPKKHKKHKKMSPQKTESVPPLPTPGKIRVEAAQGPNEKEKEYG